jgi:ABC-type transport system involved in multi-copper enzyme maturation permease subunit
MSIFLGRLRAAAVIAALAGVVGSAGFLLRAGQRTPRLLLAVMALWVLSPFVALVLANVYSQRWSVPMRATLYGVTFVLTVGILAVYAFDALWPRSAQPAFVFVLVPPVSWLFAAIVFSTAALVSLSRTRRGDAA